MPTVVRDGRILSMRCRSSTTPLLEIASAQGDDVWATLSPTEIINTIFAYSSGSASVYAADGTSASENVGYNDWYNNTSNTSGSFGFFCDQQW